MRKCIKVLSLAVILFSIMCSCTKDIEKTSHVGEEIQINTEELPTRNSEVPSDSAQEPSTDKSNATYQVKIHNDTGMDFLQLKVSEYREYDWSANLLSKGDIFKNKSTRSFDIGGIEEGKTYDIVCISADNKEFVWENLALSNISKIDFKIEDYLPSATFEEKQ